MHHMDGVERGSIVSRLKRKHEDIKKNIENHRVSLVFSEFLFLDRPARIGPRVDCIGAGLDHPAGENTRTENDSNDSNDSNDCFLEVFVPAPRCSYSISRELHRDSIGSPRRAKHGKTENGFRRVNRYIPRGKHASYGWGRVRGDWKSIETGTRG